MQDAEVQKCIFAVPDPCIISQECSATQISPAEPRKSEVALGSRLHPRNLITFILMGKSEIIGSNLVLLKSLERGQLALSCLCESSIALLKPSLPLDLGTLPCSHLSDTKIFNDKCQQTAQN